MCTILSIVSDFLKSLFQQVLPMVVANRLGAKSTQLEQTEANLAAVKREQAEAADAPNTINEAISKL